MEILYKNNVDFIFKNESEPFWTILFNFNDNDKNYASNVV